MEPTQDKRHKSKYPPLRPLTAAEQEWVADNWGLAHSVAQKLARAMAWEYHAANKTFLLQQLFEEVVDGAYIGMCIGVQRYDPANPHGASVSSYVYQWISQQAQIASNEASHRAGGNKRFRYKSPRVELFSEQWHQQHGYVNEEFDAWDSRDHWGGEEEPVPLELMILLRLALDDRAFRILRRYIFDEDTYAAIGADEGLSKQRIAQIVAKALDDLRQSTGFMQALEAQRDRRDRAIQADEILGPGIGQVAA